MVFQNYALYPHMTVRNNMAYALRVRRTPKVEIDHRVTEVARLLGLEDLLDRRPGTLSGGQQQRVAMGRAIVRRPTVYLMDEPLSNLDAELRVAMRGELARLHQRLGTTTIYVTHDQVEAMTLGERVVVMCDGTIQQLGAPQELYEAPRNLFVAAFIGSPSMNLVEANVDDSGVEFGGIRVPIDRSRRPTAEGRVIVGIRPSDFEDAAFADPHLPQMEVKAEVVENLGSEIVVIFPVDEPRVRTRQVQAAVAGEEQRLLAERNMLFTARVDARSSVQVGSTTRVSVDPAKFYFFDTETGLAL